MTQQAPNPAQAYESQLVPVMFQPWVPALLDRVSPRSGDVVLDIACGTGVVARKVAPVVGADGSVVGLDISPPMLDVAESLPKPEGAIIEWRQGSAEELPFDDDSFDLVLCQQGLQFIPDKPAAVQHMHRVLRPGGTVGIAAWRDPEYQEGFHVLDDSLERHLGSVPDTPFSLGDPAELRALFRDAGFDHVQIDEVRRNVHFPSAQGFVRLVVMSSAAAVPEFGNLDDEAKNSLIEAVTRDSHDALRPYHDGDGLTFPMQTHIVVATA